MSSPISFGVVDALGLAGLLAVIAYAYQRVGIHGGIVVSILIMLSFLTGYKTALVRSSRR